MFVVSFKTSKKKIAIIAAAVILVLVGCVLIFTGGREETFAVSAMGKYRLEAADNTARIGFLKQFGWKVNEEPVEITEIIIPATFNETYEKYNDIQKEQGLDLSRYCGERCKRWTYEVTNYPNAGEGVRANLIIKDDKVIGGDISTIELDGFMHGFVNPADDPAAGKKGENSSQESSSEEPSSMPEASSGAGESGAQGDVSSEAGNAPASSSGDETVSSTERETLAPDPDMPNAPTD